MQKFKFSLQFYLGVKTKEEKALSNELYIATQNLKDLENEYNDIQNEFFDSQQNLNQNISKGISPHKMAEYYAYFDGLKIKMQSKTQQIKKAQDIVSIVQGKIVEVKKTIKMLEILKEKKYAEYLEEQQIEEAKVLDDYISYKTMNSSDVNAEG